MAEVFQKEYVAVSAGNDHIDVEEVAADDDQCTRSTNNKRVFLKDGGDIDGKMEKRTKLGGTIDDQIVSKYYINRGSSIFKEYDIFIFFNYFRFLSKITKEKWMREGEGIPHQLAPNYILALDRRARMRPVMINSRNPRQQSVQRLTRWKVSPTMRQCQIGTNLTLQCYWNHNR